MAASNNAGYAQILERLQGVSPTLLVLETTGGLEIPITGILESTGDAGSSDDVILPVDGPREMKWLIPNGLSQERFCWGGRNVTGIG